MKKRIVLCLIAIIGLLLYVINFGYEKEQETFSSDGVMYAVTVDGIAATAFPAKGDYFVIANCTGATGVWDYVNWKLNVEEITGNVSCYVSFSSENKTYFNDYLINLADTTQGSGQLVHETYDLITDNSTFDVTSTLDESDYVISSNSFSWNSTLKEWHVTGDEMSGGDEIIEFKVKSNGNYQACYTLSGAAGEIYGSFYKDGDLVKDVYVNKTACIYFGYLSTSSTIKVILHAIRRNMPELQFSMQQGNYQENISKELTDVGYRFEGKNPNNYIMFNNELWRIVGVFDEKTHGEDGKNLVKIVRDKSLGGGYAYSNKWSDSYIIKLFNGPYYNKQDGSSLSYCVSKYDYRGNITGNCDYSVSGIDVGYRAMIKNVLWYFGGTDSEHLNAYGLYEEERSLRGTPKSANGYIGLLYASDYGFSVLSNNCSRLINLNKYHDNSACVSNNWIYSADYEWLLTSFGSYSLLMMNTYGNVIDTYPSVSNSYRPTLYLNENVYYGGGDGSLLNPYIIGM